MSDPQATYSVWIDTPTGTRLAPVDLLYSMSFARKAKNVGRHVVTFSREGVDPALLKKDNMVELWRALPDFPPQFIMAGLIRRIDKRYKDDLVTLTCEDGHTLLAERIVAYKQQSTRATKSDYADDMLKEVVKENLGASATDSARDLSAYGLVVDPDLSRAPSVAWTFAWKRVLDVLNEIADLSANAGTRLYFDMSPRVISTTQVSWTFRTMIDRFGNDRTYTSNAPMVFGPERGNVDDFMVSEDYSDAYTSVYAAGQGDGNDRLVTNQVDSTRVLQSPWARRERFVSARQEIDAAHLILKAKRALRRGRPRLYASGYFLDTPQSRYGIDWSFGDQVVISAPDVQTTAHIDAINGTVGPDGKEELLSQFEVEL